MAEFEIKSLGGLKWQAEQEGGPAVDEVSVLGEFVSDEQKMENIKKRLGEGYDVAIARQVGGGAILGYQLFDYDEHELDVFMGNGAFGPDVSDEQRAEMTDKFRDLAVLVHFG